jgi:hypothetical protein
MVIKLITVLILVGHGLGHVMAPQAAFVPPGAFPRNAHAALVGMTIASTVGKALSLLWLFPMVGFVLGTYGLWINAPWYRPVLVVSAVVSITAVLPWWKVMPASSYLGALAIDALVLVAVLTPWGDELIRSFR